MNFPHLQSTWAVTESRFRYNSWAQDPSNPAQMGMGERWHALLPVCLLVMEVTELNEYFFIYIVTYFYFIKMIVTFVTV